MKNSILTTCLIFGEHHKMNAFEYFYKLGLIGVIESEIGERGGYMKQTFLDVGQYTLSNLKLPIAKYYVTHPSLNKKLKTIHDYKFYDKFNVIGYDLPLNMSRKKTLESHVHFGLDRESLTILIPEIIYSKSVALIVPLSSDWHQLENCKTFSLSLNGTENEHLFKIYSDSQTDLEKTATLQGWLDKSYPILLYTNDLNPIVFCLEYAQVISVCYMTDLIKEIITKTIHRIPFKQEPYFYFCYREFNQDEFQESKKHFFELNNTLKYQPVLLDRFQYECEVIFEKEDEILRCQVNSESYGCLICFDKPNAMLKSSKVVHRVQSNVEFDFYRNRQNNLVEGLYQFMKLIRHSPLSDKLDLNKIIIEFIRVQVKRTISEMDESHLHKLFAGKIRSNVEDDLLAFAKMTKLRLVELFQRTHINSSEISQTISTNKLRGIFPDENEFYKYIRFSSNFFLSKFHQIFIDLISILDMKPLPEYRTIFISYSTIDQKVAELIYDRLFLMGFNIRMYSRLAVDGSIRKFETSGVKEMDRMLFIASQHSLKSDPCHLELTQCFEVMRKNNDIDKLIVISLDQYILKVNPENDVIDPRRKENIRNILQTVNVSDFSMYILDNNYKNMDGRLERMIKNAFII